MSYRGIHFDLEFSNKEYSKQLYIWVYQFISKPMALFFLWRNIIEVNRNANIVATDGSVSALYSKVLVYNPKELPVCRAVWMPVCFDTYTVVTLFSSRPLSKLVNRAPAQIPVL